MTIVKSIELLITPDDIVDTRIEIEQGRAVGFAVNYRARIQGEWREVIRYDDAHGQAHVHRFWRTSGGRDRRWKEALRAGAGPGRAAYLAGQDIKRNWRRYRRLLEASL